MNLELWAEDLSGTYRIAKFASRTAAGHIVQIYDLHSGSGLHRTWHNDGRVHDRSNNPPSTFSSGVIGRPDDSKAELWGGYDLAAGQLASAGYECSPWLPSEGKVLVRLTSSSPRQRVEVWVTRDQNAHPLLEQLRAQSGSQLQLMAQDRDGGLTRVIVSKILP